MLSFRIHFLQFQGHAYHAIISFLKFCAIFYLTSLLVLLKSFDSDPSSLTHVRRLRLIWLVCLFSVGDNVNVISIAWGMSAGNQHWSLLSDIRPWSEVPANLSNIDYSSQHSCYIWDMMGRKPMDINYATVNWNFAFCLKTFVLFISNISVIRIFLSFLRT